MATLGIQINTASFSGDGNYSECYISGYTSGTLADVDGTILINGTPVTVAKGPLYTNRGPTDAYIVFDSSGSGFSFPALGVSRPYAMARRSTVGWEYDNNTSSWIAFTPSASHYIIGIIRTGNVDSNSAPGVEYASMYATGVSIQSDATFDAWLKTSPKRNVLVEAECKLYTGSVVTRYLSSRGFNTGPDDSPPSTNYQARVTGGIKFTRSLSLEGKVSLSYGDIELINSDGGLDSWLDDYWVNRKVRVLVGDTDWPRQDYRPLYEGLLTGVDARKKDRINLKLSDILERINTPISETKLGGTSDRADDLLPLCFGECHNVTPLLVDSTINEYMVHNGPIENIVEVRDNGMPVSYTPYYSTGKFRLTQQPAGTITVSVQGAKITTLDGSTNTYSNKPGDIVNWIMTQYGTAATRPGALDIDTASMVQFDTEIPVAVGIYLSDRSNVLELCNNLVASVQGRIAVNTGGKIGIVRLSLPWTGSTVASITESDMLHGSFEPKQLADVVASTKIGYCKNWTVQDGLTTGLIQEHIAMFAEEWLSQTVSDSAAAANYNLYTDPDMVETYLLTAADAYNEANRRTAMFSTQRKVFKFTSMVNAWSIGLGSYINVTASRFGLSAGKVGQVTSIAIDPLSSKTDFEVLI